MDKLETNINNQPQGIHIVAKPIGPRCNLNCEYCFYLEKQALFPKGEDYVMSDEDLALRVVKRICEELKREYVVRPT